MMSGFPLPKKRTLESGIGAISETTMKLEAKAFPCENLRELKVS